MDDKIKLHNCVIHQCGDGQLIVRRDSKLLDVDSMYPIVKYDGNIQILLIDGLLEIFNINLFFVHIKSYFWDSYKLVQKRDLVLVMSEINHCTIAILLNMFLDLNIIYGPYYFSCVIGFLHYKQWDLGGGVKPVV